MSAKRLGRAPFALSHRATAPSRLSRRTPIGSLPAPSLQGSYPRAEAEPHGPVQLRRTNCPSSACSLQGAFPPSPPTGACSPLCFPESPIPPILYQPDSRPTHRTCIGLCVEAAVCWIVVLPRIDLRGTSGRCALVVLGRSGISSMIVKRGPHCAVDERIAIAPISRVKELPKAIGARSDIRRNELRRSTTSEWRISKPAYPRGGTAGLDRRNPGKRRTPAGSSARNASDLLRRALHLDVDSPEWLSTQPDSPIFVARL